MKMKTATRIAIYGTIIAALMGIARPWVVDWLLDGRMKAGKATFFLPVYYSVPALAGRWLSLSSVVSQHRTPSTLWHS
jgi:hypothetical protein